MLIALFLVLAINEWPARRDVATLALAVGAALVGQLVAPHEMLLVAMSLFPGTLVLRHHLSRGRLSTLDLAYVATALAAAIGIPVVLRAVPFAVKSALRGSAPTPKARRIRVSARSSSTRPESLAQHGAMPNHTASERSARMG